MASRPPTLSGSPRLRSWPDARRCATPARACMLDAVTAYMNVLANQSLVDAQRINVAFLRETLNTTRKRLDAGDVTPTDVAQAEARQSRGLADLNATEVALAVSQALYAQVIGAPPGRLVQPAPDRPAVATHARRCTRHGPQGASRDPRRHVRHRLRATRHQDRGKQPVAAGHRAGRRLAQPQRRHDSRLQWHRQCVDPRPGECPASTTAGLRRRRSVRRRNWSR